MAANVDALIRRHEQIKRKRTLLELNWRECYDYTYPLRGAKLALNVGNSMNISDADAAQSYARAQVARIFDSTATDSVRILASSLVAGSTPSSSRWLGFGIVGQDDDEEQARPMTHASGWTRLPIPCGTTSIPATSTRWPTSAPSMR